MTDPLEPFRAELRNAVEEFPYRRGTMDINRVLKGDLSVTMAQLPAINCVQGEYKLRRAARALQIAETQGPQAAVYWLVSN